MTDVRPNPKNQEIWNGIFADVPPEWRTAPPSAAMGACARWLREVGARSVLDLGCGMGRWTVWLRRQGFETAGADFAPHGIRYARRWAATEGLAIPFECVPITQRAFPERRFDAVITALVLDLVSRAEFATALEMIRASLQREGHLFALFNPVAQPSEETARTNPTAGIIQIEYSGDELRQHLASAGFQLLRSQDFDLNTRGFLWQALPARSSISANR